MNKYMNPDTEIVSGYAIVECRKNHSTLRNIQQLIDDAENMEAPISVREARQLAQSWADKTLAPRKSKGDWTSRENQDDWKYPKSPRNAQHQFLLYDEGLHLDLFLETREDHEEYRIPRLICREDFVPIYREPSSSTLLR